MKKQLIAVLTAGLVAGFAWGESRIQTPMWGGYLKFACADNSESAQGFCKGAIEAYYSTNMRWCVPESVTHKTVQRVIRDRLKLATAEELAKPAEVLVDIALQETWPCQ